MPHSSLPVILQVLPNLNTGGVEQTAVDMAQAILQQGWKAVVVSTGGRMLEKLQTMGAEHVYLPMNSKNPLVMYQNIKRLQSVIKKYNVSLVHARSRAPAWSAYYGAKWSQIPFVTTFHGTYNTKGFFKKFYNSVMTRGDLVIANSAFTARHIQDMYFTSSVKIRIIPRGVDLTRFDPQKIDQSEIDCLKREWGIEPRDTRLIFIMPGRLTSWKGQKVFLDALSTLNPEDYYAFLVGDDQGRVEYRNNLENLIKTYQLEKNVRIIGHRSDMPLILACADVVVSASLDPEAFGRVMIEAFSMERPVVATKHGGALEIIEDGKTGFFVKPGDSKSLAQGLKKMLYLDPEVRSQMGCEGRKRVVAEFSKNLMCTRTLNVYKELLCKKSLL